MVGHVWRAGRAANRSNKIEQIVKQEPQNQVSPLNPNNDPKIEILMIEVELAGQADQIAWEAVQENKANSLVCNGNAVLAATNQKLRQMLAAWLEQQRQFELQIARQKEALKNKRCQRLFVTRGQREGEGAMVEAHEPYELNPSNEEENFANLESTNRREFQQPQAIPNSNQQNIARRTENHLDRLPTPLE